MENTENTPETNNTLLVENEKAYLEFLGLSTPGGSRQTLAPHFMHKHQYFITINLSPNSKLYAVHDHTYGIFFWWNLTQAEQLRTLKHCFNKFDKEETRILACFEQTKDGNIHAHLIVDTKMSIKNISIQFFDIIYTSVKTQKNIRNIMKYFIDVKLFEYAKWNDYFNKYEKTYQTLQLPLYKNI